MNKFLRQAMRERGWTIPQLAEACDISLGLAQRWVSENPRYRVIPSPASCAKIAHALDLEPDYVLQVAGHRHPTTLADPVQSELDARLARLSRVLGHYPRAFWLAVIEASERMADAGQLLEGRVNVVEQGGVNAPKPVVIRDEHGPTRGLTPTSSPRSSHLHRRIHDRDHFVDMLLLHLQQIQPVEVFRSIQCHPVYLTKFPGDEIGLRRVLGHLSEDVLRDYTHLSQTTIAQRAGRVSPTHDWLREAGA